MRINQDVNGWYWWCFTCNKRGRHANTRELAAVRGEAHLANHRKQARIRKG